MNLIARLTFAVVPTLAAVGVGASTPGAQPKPPSSLEPTPEWARVVIMHEERRTRSCTKSSSGWCWSEIARLRKVGALRLRLVPITGPRFGRKDERTPIDVTIPAGPGPPPSHALVLAAGAWEIEVPRSRVHRFFVRDGDDFSIGITTYFGWCVERDDACELDPTFVWRSVRVPPERRHLAVRAVKCSPPPCLTGSVVRA